ncbi:MAG: hypothetical protein RJS97_02820 [Parvibaculaceae bacterium]
MNPEHAEWQAMAIEQILRDNAPAADRARMEHAAAMRRLMKRARQIARFAARVFGGSASHYIAQAMVQAHAERRGDIDAFNADRTLMHIEARTRKPVSQHAGGRYGRNWYASAVGA